MFIYSYFKKKEMRFGDTIVVTQNLWVGIVKVEN